MSKIFKHIVLSLVLSLVMAGALQAQQRGGTQASPPGGAGQTTGISGSVVDAETREAIQTASVAVWNAADSSLATGAITDGEGRFIIEGVRPGTYYVRISFVGYLTETVSDVALSPGAPRAELEEIALRPDAQMMEEVVVEGARDFMEIGIDKTVYNTKDQLVTVGGSASDVLQEIPSVEVDIDGNISLRGNQNVAVLINGRPTSMTGEALFSYLQGLPSNAVERVEVIPNPSARYEPDGMSGILNIVLGQAEDRGLGGSVTAGAGTQGTYNASGSISFQQGRLSTYTNYGFRHNERDFGGEWLRENRASVPLSIVDQDDIGEGGGDSHNLNASLEYKLSDRNMLSASTVLSLRGGNQSGLNAYRVLDADRDILTRYSRARLGDRSDFNQDYRLAFSRVLEAGQHELTAEVRFESEDGSNESIYTQQNLHFDGTPADDTPLRQRTDQTEGGGETAVQVDYVRPLGSGRVEAGYKGSLRNLDSRFSSRAFDYVLDRFVVEPGLTNTFDYQENLHAAYGIVQQDFGRFGAQVGVRMEQALTTFDLTTTQERFENDYFSVFPSAFVTYQLQESETGRKQVKLSYSKRVNRPNTWQLNPFDDLQDPLSRRIGNPYLSPEYIHSMEASYIQFTGPASLTLTPYYRKTVNQIRWHEFLNDEGVSIVTFENFASSDSWGAEAIGTLRLSSLLNTHGSFNAFRMRTDGSNVESDLGNEAWGWSMRGNATLNVQRGLAVQLSYFYRAPMEIENGRIGAFSMFNVGVRQQLLGERASLSLQVRDPFDTMGMNTIRETDRFYQESFRSFNARQLNLTFTYNFGRQDENRRDRPNMEGGEQSEEMREVQM